METKQLIAEIKQKKSFLCIGLDINLDKIPSHLLQTDDPIFQFNKEIIQSTHHLAVAYKPNTAFYERYGYKGWQSLQKTITYLKKNHPEIYTIADAKRGDIGNTSTNYAKAVFEEMDFDAITVNPYMGKDSVEPFLAYTNKHTILLALTSNLGAFDFQTQLIKNKPLYERVLETSQQWKNSQNLMYVVGATKANYLVKIREIIPHNFLLIPGIGIQGGSLERVCQCGITRDVGLLVNSSRDIIYASNQTDFATAAKDSATKLQFQMAKILKEKGL